MRANELTVRLNYNPRPWQLRVRRERRRFNVVVAHRRSGKSLFAMMELVDAALRCDKPLGLFAYVAPQLKQAKAIAWAALKELAEPLRAVGAVVIGEAELSLRFQHNGATIRLHGADDPNALRGIRLDGVVLDEVAQMAADLWPAVVRPALSDRGGWAIFIGTPAGVDTLHRLYHDAEGKPDWYRVVIPCTDTNALSASEIERMRAELPEQTFLREMMCDFGATASDQLLSTVDVEAAAARTIVPRDIEFAARIIGVDPARFGDDRSVIMRRQGLAAFPPLVLRGVDNMELASAVAREIVGWQADAVFIDAGAGAGVIDRLRQLGHRVAEVPFGGKALRPNFANRRSEMWCELASWIKGGGQIPKDHGLMQELATPTFRFDAQGRKVLESKDDIRKRLDGRSCDLGDALALCFAAEVAPRRRWEDDAHDRHAPRRYSPYSPEAEARRLRARESRGTLRG